MPNFAAIRAKANAHYRCQECSSTELIQRHHSIPGDDSTIVVLCADCHSKKHPCVPKALFLSVLRQSYWFNKSAASLARELGVHSRTIIRAAKRLQILPGELNPWDEELIRNNIPKLRPKVKSSARVRPETRDRLHSVKNPGQTLDGIITQLIDLWEKVKEQEAVGASQK